MPHKFVGSLLIVIARTYELKQVACWRCTSAVYQCTISFNGTFLFVHRCPRMTRGYTASTTRAAHQARHRGTAPIHAARGYIWLFGPYAKIEPTAVKDTCEIKQQHLSITSPRTAQRVWLYGIDHTTGNNGTNIEGEPARSSKAGGKEAAKRAVM